MNVYELAQHIEEVADGQIPPDMSLMSKHIAQLITIARLADLVNAEFKSDPTSVQCFDLNTIVYPLDRALKALEAV